jgi:hypothetical protein
MQNLSTNFRTIKNTDHHFTSSDQSKKEEKDYKETIRSELNRTIDRDPKHFWKLIS